MAISKSRLGRGLGNLIAGGISGGAKPQPTVSKPSPAPARKATGAATTGKHKPAAKPAAGRAQATKPAASKAQVTKPAAGKARAAKPVASKAQATKSVANKKSAAKPATKTSAGKSKPAPVKATAAAANTTTKGKATTSAKPAANAAATHSQTATTTAGHAQTGHTPAPSAPTHSQTAAAAGHVEAAAAGHVQATAAGHAQTGSPHSQTAPATDSAPPLPAAATATHRQAAAASLPVTGAAQSAASPYREISVAAVVPNPYQPRRDMDPEHIAELANSIASEGLLQPIVVRPIDGGRSYELIAGERRWRAHQKLGLKSIAARVMDASDSSSAVISLIENIQRQALNPIEEALGFASLMRDFDLTQEAVSERIGRARASIANALRLLGLDREIQGYVAKGILSVGHAKILLGLEEPAQRLLIARRIIEAGMSVRETEVLVKRLKNDRHARPGGGGAGSVSEADRTAIADLEKQLSSRLNTRVQLRHTPKKGRIVIEYYGNEDLQRILERTGLQL